MDKDDKKKEQKPRLARVCVFVTNKTAIFKY